MPAIAALPARLASSEVCGGKEENEEKLGSAMTSAIIAPAIAASDTASGVPFLCVIQFRCPG